MNLRCLILIAAVAGIATSASASLAGDVFTAAMAGEVLGEAIAPSPRNANPDVETGGSILSQSGYTAKTSDGNNVAVNLLLRRSPTVEGASSIFLASKRNFHGEDIPTFGEVVAYRTAMPAQLNLLLGRDWLIISAGIFPHADTDLQERVARQILRHARQ